MEKASHSVLKIYASSTDRLGSGLLYETVVYRAREAGISGATVYRGVMGYGLSSHIHTSKFWELTEKLPVVVELIDTEEKSGNSMLSSHRNCRHFPKVAS